MGKGSSLNYFYEVSLKYLRWLRGRYPKEIYHLSFLGWQGYGFFPRGWVYTMYVVWTISLYFHLNFLLLWVNRITHNCFIRNIYNNVNSFWIIFSILMFMCFTMFPKQILQPTRPVTKNGLRFFNRQIPAKKVMEILQKRGPQTKDREPTIGRSKLSIFSLVSQSVDLPWVLIKKEFLTKYWLT